MPEDNRKIDDDDETIDDQSSNPLEDKKLPSVGNEQGNKEPQHGNAADKLPTVGIDEEDMTTW